MKISSIKKNIPIAAAALLTIFTFNSCSQSKKDVITISEDSLILDVKPSSDIEPVSPNYHKEDRGIIAVVMGSEYNEDEYYPDIVKALDEKYGLEENGGIISTVRFPVDMKNRVSNLKSYLLEIENLHGVIIVGAPNRTHDAISKVNEEWDEMRPFPVFSLFPKDNILGEESACDIVLDYKENVENEEAAPLPKEKIQEILEKALDYMILADQPLEKNLKTSKDMQEHAQNIVKNRTVIRYVDSETGIGANNHFIIEW